MIYDVSEMDQLNDLARALCQRISSVNTKTIMFLHGDLGAGKTTLVQSMLRHMGHTGIVSSPTFTIINHYDIGSNHITHIDLYRLHSEEELDMMGWDLVLEKSDLLLIEWPNLLSVKPDIEVTLSEKGGTRTAEVN